ARAGGFHFRLQQGQWCDTRDGGELFAALSKLASEHAAVALSLNA
ncbi:MAG: frataxin domain-containing protein, partial [Burkholderiaceae bacterium]